MIRTVFLGGQRPARQARPGRLSRVVAVLLASAAPAHAQSAPTSSIRIRVEQRTRLEQLETDFRTSPNDGLTALALRTLLVAEVGPSTAYVAVELADSRVYADGFAPLNTTQVDALEILSGYVGLRGSGLVTSDDAALLRLGRLTLDRGNRRLVARNRYRNTINAFTGLDLTWTRPSRAVRVFAVVPVTRRPSDQASLADNTVQIDKENPDVLFWGAEYEWAIGGGARAQAYVVGLDERDGSVATSNRRLVTPGLRLVRPAATGGLDFELEAMLQVGTSRASTAPSDVRDLTHRAFAGHASAGYRFPGPWSLWVSLQYDYAGGDGDPGDGRNGRFDPLFGARAFELNPTGFYGAFARSNISSPGLRVEAARGRLELMGDYRLFWLASARDVWTTAGLGDPTGGSGSFVGRQLEGRIRARVVPGVATLDVGGAVLSRGSFSRNVIGGRTRAAVYLYSQLTIELNALRNAGRARRPGRVAPGGT